MTECNICLSQFSSIKYFLMKLLISEFAATLNDNFDIFDLVRCKFYNECFWLSRLSQWSLDNLAYNLLTVSVPGESYCRTTPYTLRWISTFSV